MKKIIILSVFLYSFILTNGQSKGEIGLFLGSSYYNGDINKSKQFYSPAIAYGIHYKYNVDTRISARVGLFYGGLSANGLDFNDITPQAKNTTFSSKVVDFNVLIEFNFFRYDSWGFIDRNTENFSPYVFTGIGGYWIFGGQGFTNPISIPFGLGIKYNIFDRLTLGMEWSFRKTFNDNIDMVENITDTNNIPIIHNDDWFSFCGVFVTYSINREKVECPTYN
ncbi:MAG: DUF6089 family protein [Bacteroidales bacterium]|jgi:hypothetical protein|nr:DUF6089 family protein [Bacteroidales bacterium]